MAEIHPFSAHPHGGLVTLTIASSFVVLCILFLVAIFLSVFSGSDIVLIAVSPCFLAIGILTHFSFRDCGMHSRQILWVAGIIAAVTLVLGGIAHAQLGHAVQNVQDTVTAAIEQNPAAPGAVGARSISMLFHQPLYFPTVALLMVLLYTLVPLLFDWKDVRQNKRFFPSA